MTVVDGARGTELEPVEVVDAELMDDDVPAVGEAAVPDPVAAVLAALDTDAKDHLNRIRPKKTRDGYAQDWEKWRAFHAWLAAKTGVPLPLSSITVGTFVSFVTYLDQVVEAPPNTIERRITGVTSEVRSRGYTVPKEATEAARRALKPLKLDENRMKRGRGKGAAIAPADLRTMAEAPRERQPQPTARTRRVFVVPEVARLRDQALNSLKLAVAGRNEEMSVLDDAHVQVVDEGLKVYVPSVKGRPPRTVPVTYGENRATCPVRCWRAWQEAKLAAGADPEGPALLSVDQWGHLGNTRLSPDGVGRALARCAKYAGLTGRRITGHSARRGSVTTGIKKGKRVDKLRRQGGWSANSPVFWEYVDEGTMFEDAPTEGIGF
ncbi:hypothetical protein AQJ43_37760 [Streptomyces avermitilis]|uniref:Integrase n=2 Tax=Streptomyces avermitilis TaxID=33903 RepID=A0A143T2E5_STRAW|nr:hypothetical protein [Streptomyces avermitilis]KUN46662.1 hypothetical protein AQJ43_37760 [Streptomyces avermitilis]BAU77592.1 hypothetical protein SAVERM_2p149 [Streptomyces avermitilis MA-4680 = NBRC 14893]GDY70259.1 integrase [Streptomyces avermitilis]GDY80567.1 integrase [Streptomyces avermitilis]